MKTRKQYMDGTVSFDEYYGQFVNDEVLRAVKNGIGVDAIKASKNEHFNDIRLEKWDRLAGFHFIGSEMISRPHGVPWGMGPKLKEAGEGFSAATAVCILKQAARRLIA